MGVPFLRLSGKTAVVQQDVIAVWRNIIVRLAQKFEGRKGGTQNFSLALGILHGAATVPVMLWTGIGGVRGAITTVGMELCVLVQYGLWGGAASESPIINLCGVGNILQDACAGSNFLSD